MITVKIIDKTNLNNPRCEIISSSGVDLQANVEMPVTLKPRGRALISTGLFMEIPVGYEGMVIARSGLAIKVHAIDTINPDYRAEIKVMVINIGDKDFTINNGDIIAQMKFLQLLMEMKSPKRYFF
ncbi:MAG: dUTP diphosphatase [Clostridiaceae bacterium]|jgi:dUTP pyrophosphatase|nr:dUTP diphosphatase [Clostridiaceae bacterium]